MHTTRAAGRRLLLGLAALLCATLTLTPHAATAADDAPPVTKADKVSMFAGGHTMVDVLANDSDPDGDVLEVCRLTGVPDQLMVLEAGDFLGEERPKARGSLMVYATRPGTYTFEYYACDFSTLVPATVTVTVHRVAVKVRKVEDRPGKLRVINGGSFRLRFAWGKWDNEKPDGSVVVPAHSRVRITVRRPSVAWVAFNPRRGAVRLGNVRNIELPAGVRPWKPGAAPPELLHLTGQVGRWGAAN